MLKNFLIALVLVAACFLQDADAIKCFNCTSTDRPVCAKSSVNALYKDVDCEAVKPVGTEEYLPVTKCSTLRYKDAAGVTYTSRGCHFVTRNNPKPDECILQAGQTKESCELCNSDKCNGNSAGRLATFGIVAVLAAVAIPYAF